MEAANDGALFDLGFLSLKSLCLMGGMGVVTFFALAFWLRRERPGVWPDGKRLPSIADRQRGAARRGEPIITEGALCEQLGLLGVAMELEEIQALSNDEFESLCAWAMEERLANTFGARRLPWDPKRRAQ